MAPERAEISGAVACERSTANRENTHGRITRQDWGKESALIVVAWRLGLLLACTVSRTTAGKAFTKAKGIKPL